MIKKARKKKKLESSTNQLTIVGTFETSSKSLWRLIREFD